jgi:hypothetical protein
MNQTRHNDGCSRPKKLEKKIEPRPTENKQHLGESVANQRAARPGLRIALAHSKKKSMSISGLGAGTEQESEQRHKSEDQIFPERTTRSASKNQGINTHISHNHKGKANSTHTM